MRLIINMNDQTIISSKFWNWNTFSFPFFLFSSLWKVCNLKARVMQIYVQPFHLHWLYNIRNIFYTNYDISTSPRVEINTKWSIANHQGSALCVPKCVYLLMKKKQNEMKLQKFWKMRKTKNLGGVQRLNQYHSKCLKQ